MKKSQLDLSKYFISPMDHECLHKISWESIEELLRYFSQDELMCYTRSCVTEYIMNLPAVMDKYASTSDTCSHFHPQRDKTAYWFSRADVSPSHKNRQLYNFTGTDLKRVEPGDTQYSKMRLVYTKYVPVSGQMMFLSDLQLRPVWLWTVLELSLWWMKRPGWPEAILNQLN